MKAFIKIFRWRMINQNIPYNVQIFKDNQYQFSQDFKTHNEACIFANNEANNTDSVIINEVTESDLAKDL